ncbi:Hypothetical protein B590_28784 [Streptomyces sp. PVA_94-07]|nr:Hypothetical protein B590_28784 [Streptomyces sp. PVA_94-07]
MDRTARRRTRRRHLRPRPPPPLAATSAHRQLAAYWAGHRTPDNGPHPGEAAAALVAALLTADLLAWAVPGPNSGLPARRRLRRVDLRDLTVTEHPVLPVPPVAPLPGRGSGPA